jgi:hypothetical protein
MWGTTLDFYSNGIEHYNGLSPEDAALENMRLVYLRRTQDEGLWMPPGARDADEDTVTD